MFPILCPRCRKSLPIANIMQDRRSGKARGRCQSCKSWIPIALPSIRKKLIYLDQSFLSTVCLREDKSNSETEVRIHFKLQTLKAQQKIVLVVSDVHSRETSAIPDQFSAHRDKLWKFQNDLADGRISVDWEEVFIVQQRRLIINNGSAGTFPPSDIGLDNPHQFHTGMHFQSTNSWRQRLDREGMAPRSEVNDAFRKIIEQQLASMSSCTRIQDCFTHILQLWREDIRQGIAAWQEQQDLHSRIEQFVEELEAGQIPDISPVNLSSPFRRIVGNVVQGLDEHDKLQKWLGMLASGSAGLGACVRIRIALGAELLWRWHTASPPSNPTSFNRGFGISRQNDINHISTYAPYVEALTTDDEMRSFCKNELAAHELTQFSCKIFSKSNYSEFESWLDTLLNEPLKIESK